MKFFVIRVRRLFEDVVYFKSNFLIAKNSMELKNIVINESKFPKHD